MEYKLRRLDRQLASDGKVLSFYRDTMELPDGKTEPRSRFRPAHLMRMIRILPSRRPGSSRRRPDTAAAGSAAS